MVTPAPYMKLLRAFVVRLAKRPTKGICREHMKFLIPTQPPRLMSFSSHQRAPSVNKFTSLVRSPCSHYSKKSTTPCLSWCTWKLSLSWTALTLVELNFVNPSLATPLYGPFSSIVEETYHKPLPRSSGSPLSSLHLPFGRTSLQKPYVMLLKKSYSNGFYGYILHSLGQTMYTTQSRLGFRANYRPCVKEAVAFFMET